MKLVFVVVILGYCLELLDVKSGLEKGRSVQTSSGGEQVKVDSNTPWTVPAVNIKTKDRPSLVVTFNQPSRLRGVRIERIQPRMDAGQVGTEGFESRAVDIGFILLTKTDRESDFKPMLNDLGFVEVRILHELN